MSKIDLTKVKPGDKVTIEVTAFDIGGLLFFDLSLDGSCRRTLDPSHRNWSEKADFTIVGHTPAPHVWKAGDRFKFTDSVETERTIVFIDEDSVLFTGHKSGRVHFPRSAWENNLYRIHLFE